MGVSVDAKSQKAAEREAIDECVTRGGGAICLAYSMPLADTRSCRRRHSVGSIYGYWC